MTTDLDWLDTTRDPRVVAVVLARDLMTASNWRDCLAAFVDDLAAHGIVATEPEAQNLLNAVAAWDKEHPDDPDDDLKQMLRDVLDSAVTAIVGEQRRERNEQ